MNANEINIQQNQNNLDLSNDIGQRMHGLQH